MNPSYPAQVREVLESGAVKLETNLWDNFNASRESLVGFVGEFEEFVSQTNKEFGESNVKVGESWTTLHLLFAWRLERPLAL